MLTIELASNEYAEDFADTAELGVLVRGDIYDGALPLGYYTGRWFPRSGSDIELLVVLVDASGRQAQCSLAFRCARRGQPRLVEPAEIWMDGAPQAIPMSVGEAHAHYPAARDRATVIVQLVLAQDKLVHEYVAGHDG